MTVKRLPGLALLLDRLELPPAKPVNGMPNGTIMLAGRPIALNGGEIVFNAGSGNAV